MSGEKENGIYDSHLISPLRLIKYHHYYCCPNQTELKQNALDCPTLAWLSASWSWSPLSGTLREVGIR